MSDKQVMKPGPKVYGHEYNPESKLDVLAQDLERKLSDTIFERATIDHRMVEDLQAYHGVYPKKESEDRENAGRANTNVKLTRAKTNAGEAQLVDLLFPNDDKNWGIRPTPVPEISKLLKNDEPEIVDGEQYADEQGNVITKGMVAKRKQELLDERCQAMEEEINDQLVECSYNSKARQAIHDSCVIGTGILKGPVVVGKLDKVYLETSPGEFTLEMKESFQPAVEVVRPWDFFPDMSASSIDEAEFVFERRYMSRQQLRDLTRRKGFPKEQIQRVLAMNANQTQHTSTYQDDVRQLAGLSDTLNDTRYETWEYHGPISYQVLEQLGAVEPSEDDNSQTEVIATVFYCGGIVLGARTHLMEYENYLPYRVFNWEKDDSCIFGIGIPRMAKDEQAIINSVWRMILDNGAITAGPQIGINPEAMEPADGSWALKPFKVWKMKKQYQDIRQVFSSFEFKSNLNDLSAIYQTARVLFDEVVGIPMLGQGEQGQSTQTLGGMSMLMNAANTVRRRQVKSFDDDITSPLIKDFYHYNMENSTKPDIKGDFQVDARGTSALLVKETQSQAIANFINMAGNSEIFAPALKIKSLEILRQWARTQSLPANVVPSDDEWKDYLKRAEEQAQSQPQDPAMAVEQLRVQQQQVKFQHETQIEQFKAQQRQQEMQFEAGLKLQLASSQERIELAKLAQEDKHNTEKLMTELKKVQTDHAANWQHFMAEVQIKKQAGLTANFGLDGVA